MLLIDNASSHFNPDKNNNQEIEKSGNLNLSHIKVHFFLSNIMVHLQPIDIEIIKSFKAIYKQHYIQHILHQFEANVDLKK